MHTIVFDFDGVIHDTFDLAFKINVSIFGEDLTKDQYRDFFNGNIFKSTTPDQNKKFFEMQNKSFQSLKMDNNIKQNLEKLSELYSLFIISSNQEKTLHNYLKNNNSSHIFKEILGAETHHSKVHKFNYLFEKYNLLSDDCVFVTDTLGDILEGNKVPVRTIAVDFGFHERERLEKGNPYKIVSSFGEIIEIVKDI